MTYDPLPSLGGYTLYFAEDTREGRSDREIVRDVLKEAPDLVMHALAYGKELLVQPHIPWKELSRNMNRYFTDEQEAREWLEEMLRITAEEIQQK